MVGSLARATFAGPSDVDLLVVSCPPEWRYRLESVVEDAVGDPPFDVIYLDEVPAPRRETLLAEARRASDLVDDRAAAGDGAFSGEADHMVRSENERLGDILKAVTDVETFVAGMDVETFAADDKTFAAVLYALVVIGEASKALPPELQRRHPNIAWGAFGRLQDAILRQGFGFDRGQLWKTVTRDLPPLKQAVRQELGA